MKKLFVFLDLDNTLICSVPFSQLKAIKNYNEIPLNYIDTPEDAFKGPSDPTDGYRIYLRNGLQQFLSYLFYHFDVGVWTHSVKEYASFVVNNVILKDHPERIIKYFLTREDCDAAMELGANGHPEFAGLKNLNFVFATTNLKPTDTVIVDDLDLVKMTNPYNCIPITPFRIEFEGENIMLNGFTNTGFLNVGTILYLLKENYNASNGFEHTQTIPILLQSKMG